MGTWFRVQSPEFKPQLHRQRKENPMWLATGFGGSGLILVLAGIIASWWSRRGGPTFPDAGRCTQMFSDEQQKHGT